MAALTTAALVGANMLGSYQQAQAERDQADYTERMGNINARRDELAAEDTVRRGEKEAVRYGSKVRQTVGAQKASLAAQGIDVNTGNSADLIEQTSAQGAEDIATIRSNSFREALGYQTRAVETRESGKMAVSAAKFKATSTLVTAGMKGAGQAYDAGYFGKK